MATRTIDGGSDGHVFAVFLDEVQGPHPKDGDFVVMVNAGAHKDPCVRTILASYGAKPVYLPPDSPELNPIELAWSKLKGFLRTTKARTVPSLNEAIGVGMKVITPARGRKLVSTLWVSGRSCHLIGATRMTTVPTRTAP